MPNLDRLQYARDLMKSKRDSEVSMNNVLSECRSVGCIVGWCTTDVEHFPEIGFTPELGEFYRRGVDEVVPAYKYADVGAELFSIPLSDARDLFCDADDDNWLDDFLFEGHMFLGVGPHPSDREVAIKRLEYAIERYSKGLPLWQEPTS